MQLRGRRVRIDDEQNLAVVGGEGVEGLNGLVGGRVALGEHPQQVVLGAVAGGHHRGRLLDGGQQLDEALAPDVMMGGVEEIGDVDVGSLPDPVLVGEAPVGDQPRRLELGQRLVDVALSQAEDLPRGPEGPGGGDQVQHCDGLGQPPLAGRQPVGVPEPGGYLGPAARPARRPDAQRAAGHEIVVNRLQAQRREPAPGGKVSSGEEGGGAGRVRAG